MSEPIHQETLFNADPQRVYDALTDAVQFTRLSGGAPAEISGDAGGALSCFGGKIVGRNVETLPGKRLVQAWRVADWPPGIYSLVRFELVGEGGGTRLIFDQTAIPEGLGGHLAVGWSKMYWEPMRNFFQA